MRGNPFSPSSSLRCGCPVDTSAKQKHRPSRQARPPCNGCGNPFSFKRITDSFALCAQNDITFVIAVRVSGGHLCKAEHQPSRQARRKAAVAIRYPVFHCANMQKGPVYRRTLIKQKYTIKKYRAFKHGNNVLASTYFSGQLPAEYLQRKRA